MANVEYLPEVVDYINDLTEILIDKQYFSYPENAKQYTSDLISEIENYIDSKKKHPAPSYFNRYGKNMHYIIYRPNRKTTWYVFFQHKDNDYLIRFITNNHVKAHYIRGL